MKIYFIMLVGLILSTATKAQKKIDNHVATMHLPNGTKSIATVSFEEYSERNFKRALKPFENSESFIVDDALLVSIREFIVSPASKKSLEKWKRQLESVYKQTNQTWDESKIYTINGNRFFIFEEHLNDEYKLLFFSEDVGNKNLNGYIAYKAKNRDKAHVYLNNLLKDVKLKKQ